VWFFGFMVVAGEWFAMWQSQTWNGQEAAFRFYMAVLGVLIFVALPDGDLGGPPKTTPKRRRTDGPPHRRSA
jgi:predicted small integral membrane protein